MKSCETCEFWSPEEPPTDDPGDEKVGVCRRYPPQSGINAGVVWTPEDYWCGEWKQQDAFVKEIWERWETARLAREYPGIPASPLPFEKATISEQAACRAVAKLLEEKK